MHSTDDAPILDPSQSQIGAVQGNLVEQSEIDLDSTANKALLRNRNFLLIWTAQAISQTAQQAVWYALLIVVATTTGSTTQLSFAVISATLPSVVFSLLAGIFVDRMEKRGVMLITTALRAVVMLGYLLHPFALPVVYAVNFLSNSLTQFFQPAESSMLPQLVRKKQLLAANSLYNITFNGSQVAGLVILGPLLAKLFGADVIFIGAALLTGLAAFEVFLLPKSIAPEKSLRDLKRETVVRELATDLNTAWRFITLDAQTLLAMLHLTLCSLLTLLVGTIAPTFATQVLGIREDDAVFVIAPAGLGLALGAVVLNQLTKRFTRPQLVQTGLWTMIAGFVVLSYVAVLVSWVLGVVAPGIEVRPLLQPTVMVISAILGLAIAFVMIPSQTNIMERAPRASLGRIVAVQIALGNAVSIIPLLLVGQLADRYGINQVILGVAFFILLITFFTIWYPRSGIAMRASERIQGES